MYDNCGQQLFDLYWKCVTTAATPLQSRKGKTTGFEA